MQHQVANQLTPPSSDVADWLALLLMEEASPLMHVVALWHHVELLRSFTAVQPSTIRWASRWDTYLVMMDDQIHWFSIINSLMIVLFLSGMVAMIMMRTLHRDISKYNQLETAEEAQEETGWKLVRFFILVVSAWWATRALLCARLIKARGGVVSRASRWGVQRRMVEEGREETGWELASLSQPLGAARSCSGAGSCYNMASECQIL